MLKKKGVRQMRVNLILINGFPVSSYFTKYTRGSSRGSRIYGNC